MKPEHVTAELYYRRYGHQHDKSARENSANSPVGLSLLHQLTAAHWKLLHELSWLVRCRRRNAPGQAPYVQPGQTYLADKCGISREWANRCIADLHRLGFIKKIWRRAIAGNYQTCLYFVTERCRWHVGRLINLVSRSDRVNNTAHKFTSGYIYNENRGQFARLGDILTG